MDPESPVKMAGVCDFKKIKDTSRRNLFELEYENAMYKLRCKTIRIISGEKLKCTKTWLNECAETFIIGNVACM